MTSRIKLSERIQSKLSKPQEILTWSHDKSGNVEYDNSGLRFYYPPPSSKLEREPIDLCGGYNPEKFNPDVKKTIDMDSILQGMIKIEQETGKKIDASIVTWRGVWMRLIALSQPHVDPFLGQQKMEFQVVEFDGQVFMCYTEPEKADNESPQQNLRPVYGGYQFEHIATLKRPWGECSREEIESRYDVSKHDDPLGDLSEYCMLIKAKIGSVPILYCAETDCVEGSKPESGDPHRNYVELKTSGLIYNARGAQNFERKLFKVWIQSFLARVPKIVYGFRDQNMNLKGIEEFETNKLPDLVKNSRVTPKHQRWSAKQSLDFFGVLAKFIEDRVEKGKTYMLTFDPQKLELILSPREIDIGRKVAFLSDEFVEWRLNLKAKSES